MLRLLHNAKQIRRFVHVKELARKANGIAGRTCCHGFQREHLQPIPNTLHSYIGISVQSTVQND